MRSNVHRDSGWPNPPALRKTHRPARRGVVTLWTILCLPVLFAILCLVVHTSRLWQARAQLENAVEATALAAVQDWGNRGGTAINVPAALAVGKTFLKANQVQAVPVDPDDPAAGAAVGFTFGTATVDGTGFDFLPTPDTTAQFAVVVEAQVKVRSLLRLIGGPPLRHSTVSARAAALYDPSNPANRPRLIRIQNAPAAN